MLQGRGSSAREVEARRRVPVVLCQQKESWLV